MVARIAEVLVALDEEIASLDTLVEAWFRQHRHAEMILSLPGMGVQLGAEFIAATGGDLTAFGSADRLATFAGLAPEPRDYDRKRGEGKSHQRAVPALARRRANRSATPAAAARTSTA
nr:transposase [Saccharothrix australiensis]